VKGFELYMHGYSLTMVSKLYCASQLMLAFLFQSECETFFVNRFMAAYNSTREAWALHMPLKEYAANILVRIVSLNLILFFSVEDS